MFSFRMIPIILLFSAVVIANNRLYAQQEKRNSIIGSIGFIPTVSGFYERILIKPIPGQPQTIGRVGFSGGGVYGFTKHFVGQFGIVTNRSKNRFELTLGGGVKAEEGGSPTGIFCGNIGYRLHKMGSRWMFRTGIGYPEFLYVGFGFRF